MNFLHYLGKVVEEETPLRETWMHLCFIVMSGFAFYLFVLFALSYGELQNLDLTAFWFDICGSLVGYGNLLINLLFFYVIANISLTIRNAYYAYQRDTL